MVIMRLNLKERKEKKEGREGKGKRTRRDGEEAKSLKSFLFLERVYLFLHILKKVNDSMTKKTCYILNISLSFPFK